ncbi:tetratricopeptide repeat protein [Aquisphaera insulae]|uniref:tetratricopeptide repeat protein n=1 Tax=Aquisphaera insulae TaxID=2712864 RepID=UPI0013ED1F46|nr:multiheme c-type cytochrome [Aquisphaera insulae]
MVRKAGLRAVSLALVVLAMLVGTWISWKARPARWRGPRVGPIVARPTAGSSSSPWLNARPGVAYVGDAACARCHGEIAASYRAHPMGRSIAPADEFPGLGAIPRSGATFEAAGSHFRVERSGSTMTHVEERRDGQGGRPVACSAEVAYAIGSGARATSFLIERDNRIFESPITWYARDERWGLSPGYGRINSHFDRPVVPQCLFCHADNVQPISETVNAYEPPLLRGSSSIGCERCHGPGALHVGSPGSAGDIDRTIVNPGHLEIPLREDVCAQCHLLGDQRVETSRHDVFDYRPGLPLSDYVVVFDRQREGSKRFGGHFEQMRSSRCYLASDGRLGCVSCHDPHATPAAAARSAFFRGRCLACHDSRPCSLAEPERRSRSPQDDCTACHMPQFPSTEIAHTATTDHRILRKPDLDEKPVPPAPSGRPLRAVQLANEPAPRREFAIAQAIEAMMAPDQADRARFGAEVQSALEPVIADDADDLPARLALARSLRLQNRNVEALAAYDELLRRSPGAETALDEASSIALDLGDRAAASRLTKQAVRKNPWSPALLERRARFLAVDGRIAESAGAASAALGLNPFLPLARTIRIRDSLERRDSSQARSDLDALIAINPASRPVLERWFADQERQVRPR